MWSPKYVAPATQSRPAHVQTANNFKHLCMGDMTSDSGVKLAFAGSAFHRCIKK